MKQANTWIALGTVTNRIAAKLIAVRAGKESAAALIGGESAAARFPVARREEGIEGCQHDRGFENGLTAGNRDEARMGTSAVIPDRAAEGPFAPRHSLSATSSK
jgi:hypothetical protein